MRTTVQSRVRHLQLYVGANGCYLQFKGGVKAQLSKVRTCQRHTTALQVACGSLYAVILAPVTGEAHRNPAVTGELQMMRDMRQQKTTQVIHAGCWLRRLNAAACEGWTKYLHEFTPQVVGKSPRKKMPFTCKAMTTRVTRHVSQSITPLDAWIWRHASFLKDITLYWLGASCISDLAIQPAMSEAPGPPAVCRAPQQLPSAPQSDLRPPSGLAILRMTRIIRLKATFIFYIQSVSHTKLLCIARDFPSCPPSLHRPPFEESC